MAITLHDLKPRFQRLLRPAVGALATSGVTANQLTLAAAGGSVLLGAVLAGAGQPRLFLLLPAWLLLRMALNAADGLLAREHGQQSRLGAYLNELGDLVADAALYLPFAGMAPFAPAAVVGFVLAAGIGEVAGILGASIGTGRRYDGPLGKSDRALACGALALCIGLGAAPDWLGWSMPILAALALVGAANRIRAGLAR